jgi:aminoglycoside phosphotransferase (APT) family kinase protein
MGIEGLNPRPVHLASARGSLLSMAETLSRSVLPSLDGDIANRVGECVSLMLRMAQESAPADGVRAALDALNEAASIGRPALEIAELEAAVIREADEELAALGTRIRQTTAAHRHFDGAAFQQFLRAQPRGGRDVRVTHVRQLAGGRSKLTILVQQERAIRLPADLVVRQDWAGGGVQNTTVVSEFGLLQGVHAAGLKVPEPMMVETSAMLGAPFLVLSRMAGRQSGGYFDPPRSVPAVLDLAEQVAALHQLPVAPFIAAGVARGARTVEAMRAELEGFRAVHRDCGVPARSVDIAIDWLVEQAPRIAQDCESLVHNDIGPHNLLLQGDALTAILDWELAAIDHPAVDLGYAREWIGQVLPWNQFMARYRGAGGPQFDDLALDFYTLWASVRVYVLLVRARAAIGMGAIRDMEVVYTAMDAVPRLVRRIALDIGAAVRRYGN